MSVKKFTSKIAALLDPRGPLGEVLSPSDVFKERAGLPVSTPYVQRDANFIPASAVVLAPARFAAVGEVEVPKSRMRLVSRYVEEHYAPVTDTPRFSGMAESIRAFNTIVGWNVTQKLRAPHCDCLQATLEMEGGTLLHKECGRARRHMSDEEFVEHIQNLQIAPSDQFYNIQYPTIPGTDPYIMPDGRPLRGEPVYKDGKMVHDGIIRKSTHMTGGRREYKQKTKGWTHWDRGGLKERDKAYAAEQKKWLTGVRPRLEKWDKQHMPRKLGEL
jgi:hypothetical protein